MLQAQAQAEGEGVWVWVAGVEEAVVARVWVVAVGAGRRTRRALPRST